jgi:protein-S-isoprenylcysteine O-methyltransferase Ste14
MFGDTMSDEFTFRWLVVLGVLIVMPVAAYFRLKAHTREPLDRRQEGLFILFTLRPIGLVLWVGVFAYMINPASMAWSSLSLPAPVRWSGMAIWALGLMLLIWTLKNLGKNLTDTVVTRRQHTLVTGGPYRWVRHPFYDAVALFLLSLSLLAANWFILVAGALVFALLAIRTASEERYLLARFGEPYRRYLAQTGKFLPRIR